MNKYFSLEWEHKPVISSAYAIEVPKLDHELIAELEGKTSMPYDFELKKVSEGKNGIIVTDDLRDLKETWLDYQPNNLAWPFMSEKLKVIVDDHLSGKEGINWIIVNVRANRENRVYYIPRFEQKLDVLDVQNTKYVPGTNQILRSCFSLSKVSKFSMFPNEASGILWKITPFIFVSESLKKAIQKEKLKGVAFEKALVV